MSSGRQVPLRPRPNRTQKHSGCKRPFNKPLPKDAPTIKPHANPHPKSTHNPDSGLNPNNYKTVKCKYYESGQCRYGDNCSFAHGGVDLRTQQSNAFQPPYAANNQVFSSMF